MHKVFIYDSTQEGDDLRLKTVLNGKLLDILIPKRAIANRLAVYSAAMFGDSGIETETGAIEAIVKEHATRELNLEPSGGVSVPTVPPDPRIAAMGGLRDDVQIIYGEPDGGIPETQPVLTPKQRLIQAIEGAGAKVNIKDVLAILREYAEA